jgi:hypothetical protein
LSGRETVILSDTETHGQASAKFVPLFDVLEVEGNF